jgi:hypothetical protein
VIDLDAVHGPTVAPWDDGGVSAPDLDDGVPYSYFSIAPEGGLLFTAGACPLDEDGETVAPGDVAAQAGRAETVSELLSAGADPAIRDDLHGGDARGWARFGGHSELAERL